MNPGKTLLLLQFLLCAATAAAQSAEVRFRVADRATREAVVGAVAELRSRTDTAAAPLYTTSDIDGRGTFPRVPHGDYRLTVTSLGYATCGSARQPSGSIRCGSRPAPKPSTR